MEEKISFESEKLQIEGLLHQGTTDAGIVITHPHPLYGGDMYNSVVEAIQQAAYQKGHTTLRFNFRGVGRSQGHHGNGIAEQQDVLSAVTRLKEEGVEKVLLSGYSFGAWVNAHLDPQDTDIENIIMVSPPVAFIDFASVAAIPNLDLVITGSRDEIAPVDSIRQLLPVWNSNARLELIEGADHFYYGYLDLLKSILKSAL
jgi:alpha/beta superfamily hydrolase